MAKNDSQEKGTPKKNAKTYQFQIYVVTVEYSGEFTLVATIDVDFKDVNSSFGQSVHSARAAAEEYVRNVGMFGVSVQASDGSFTYYPPSRIAKVVFSQIS